MNVISRPTLQSAGRHHPEAAAWLDAWWHVARKARWRNLHEVRLTYPSADQVGRCLILNACGNKYRLIVGVLYASNGRGGTLFVKHFLTHSEYSRGAWKKDCLP